uniref:Uncharacterized protein n=1 Tax=Romanomermis culicivorax TaxID=13658 RepID=A0A915IRM1_ROMCU
MAGFGTRGLAESSILRMECSHHAVNSLYATIHDTSITYRDMLQLSWSFLIKPDPGFHKQKNANVEPSHRIQRRRATTSKTRAQNK